MRSSKLIQIVAWTSDFSCDNLLIGDDANDRESLLLATDLLKSLVDVPVFVQTRCCMFGGFLRCCYPWEFGW